MKELLYLILVLSFVFGGHGVANSQNKVGESIETNQISQDTTRQHVLRESSVTGFLDKKLNLTQTGFRKIEASQLRSGFSFLSQPDIVKSIQTLPGVASGTELMSGLYVHGGNGSDNLFLLDGVEIYNVSHLAGLFSSFNVDVIDHLDFYKSGFPARYGGKLSSVVDVSSKVGDMNEFHGTFSIGLINGSIQLEGPIVKGRTSYNIGLRRSWLELLTAPINAVNNSKNPDEKSSLGYAMTDFNAGLTHLINNQHRLQFNIYAGRDYGKSNVRWPDVEYWDGERFYGESFQKHKMAWGNLLASLNWNFSRNERFNSRVTAYYSQSASRLTGQDNEWYLDNHEETMLGCDERSSSRISNRIHDIGIKSDFDYLPDRGNHLRMGTDFKAHLYDVHSSHQQGRFFSSGEEQIFDEQTYGSAFSAGEFSLYAEDEIGYLDWLKANIGLRAVCYTVPGKTSARVEPRAALKVQVYSGIALKFSYTEMNQFTHKLSTHNLDLPSLGFLPSNAEVAPIFSRQFAGGIYTTLPANVILNVEGFYKTMDHLMEYNGRDMYGNITDWQKDFAEGQGLSYGMEVELGWKNRNTEVTAYYTLSWNKRFFEDIHYDWFPDTHDNRHKFTVMASHKFNRHFDMNISWNYHSGDKMTVQSQYIGQDGSIKEPLYTVPNNLSLPDYHRLDLGFNYRKKTKRGNESIWNVSIYNAYCRMNPMFIEIAEIDNEFVATKVNCIPIVPMFSYTLKF